MNDGQGHDPDWGRFGIKPPNTYEKVGDPTRWGGRDQTVLANNALVESSAQIVQVASRDLYSRTWSMLGVLTMPQTAFDEPQVVAELLVTMGVGQVQIVHKIPLWYGTGIGGASLCFDQDAANGGVYSNGDHYLMPNVAGTQITYSDKCFCIVGGLLGQTVSARVRYLIAGGAMPDLPAPCFLTLIVNPFSAGQGL